MKKFIVAFFAFFSAKKSLNGRRGFTLGDALTTAAVIGIISAIAYGAYQGVQANANATRGTANARYLTKLYNDYISGQGTPASFLASGTGSVLPAVGGTAGPGAGITAGTPAMTFSMQSSFTPASYTFDTASNSFSYSGSTP